jgi:hypothetical protein
MKGMVNQFLHPFPEVEEASGGKWAKGEVLGAIE